jgi:hypothetical protein
MSRGLRFLKRQPGSPSSCRVARRSRSSASSTKQRRGYAVGAGASECVGRSYSPRSRFWRLICGRHAVWSFAPRLDQTLATRRWLITDGPCRHGAARTIVVASCRIKSGVGTSCREVKTNPRNRFDDPRAEFEQPQADGCELCLDE